MVIALLDSLDVRERILSELGFARSDRALGSSEVLSGLVRRAASVLAPCSPRVIRQRVVDGLQGLVSDDEAMGENVDSVIESLTAYGDLVELPAPEEQNEALLLYATPPTFVETAPGVVYLLGIPLDGTDVLPSSLAARVEYRRHTRRIRFDPSEKLPALLARLGLHGLPEGLWFKPPRKQSPADLVAQYDEQLRKTSSKGDVTDLEILDTSRPVGFYKGRWRPPGKSNGRFVARREQRYGARQWCYVELRDGVSERLLDLRSGDLRGCDIAWHLQLALDKIAGTPQQFSAELIADDCVAIRLFGPLPAWWLRRWDVLGVPVRTSGCLFAYELSYAQYENDLPRLMNELWLVEVPKGITREGK